MPNFSTIKLFFKDIENPESRISKATEAQIQKMIEDEIITTGMQPKVESCITALDGGVKRTHIIDGRIEHALLLEIYTDKGVGTLITK